MKNYWLNRKVLVTGANGFIGSHLCKNLIKLKSQVTAVVRSKSHLESLNHIQNKLTIKEVDLTQPAKTKKIVSDESIIIHTAAVDGGSLFKRKFSQKIFSNNILMILNILHSIKNKNVEKLLYFSSAEVYKYSGRRKKFRENDFQIFSPDKPEDWYVWSKIVGEYACRLVQATSKLKVIIARPGNIYGPDDKSKRGRLVPKLIKAVKTGHKEIKLKGNGQQIRSFLFVEDFVKNLLQLLAAVNQGTYNLAGENPIKIKDFVDIFSRFYGLKIAFTDKTGKKKSIAQNTFLLDLTKIKQALPRWYDSAYEKRVKELI